MSANHLIFIGEMHQPAFFNHFRATPFSVFYRLYYSHQWNVGTRRWRGTTTERQEIYEQAQVTGSLILYLEGTDFSDTLSSSCTGITSIKLLEPFCWCCGAEDVTVSVSLSSSVNAWLKLHSLLVKLSAYSLLPINKIFSMNRTILVYFHLSCSEK